MVYRSTEEMVERVRPLLERLAIRTIDKARLLQYLSARAGVDWGVFTLVRDEEIPDAPLAATNRRLTTMAEPLFRALFQTDYCDHCRWRNPSYAQIHHECHYAGHPVNFE